MRNYLLFCLLFFIYFSNAEEGFNFGELKEKNKVHNLAFSEEIITVSHMLSKSEIVIENRLRCDERSFCDSYGADIEAMIGLLGTALPDKQTTNTLINLLGLTLDAGGAESRDCELLYGGDAIYDQIKQSDTNRITSSCKKNYYNIIKKNSDLESIPIGDVCHTEKEIQSSIDELLVGIKAKQLCY